MSLEGVVSTVAGEILNKLGSQTPACLGMLCGLNNDLHKLRSNVSSIQAVLCDAEERQIKGDDHSLNDWLQKLGEVFYDVEDVVDEISTEALRREVMTRGKFAKQVRIFFSNSNQLAFNYRMACQLKEINERLHVISQEKNKFHFNHPNVDQPRIQNLNYLSHPTGMGLEKVIGRDDEMSNLKKLLLAEDMNVKAANNVSFIAIVGIGGIGKTTLAKALFNDKDVSDCFSLRIWIRFSDHRFNLFKILESIIESATGMQLEIYDVKAVKTKLQKVIEGKKYLLVLDDVWNEDEEQWDNVKNLLMVGARGSKVLITKRDDIEVDFEEVAFKTVHLKELPEAASWLLFKQLAFQESYLEYSTNPKLIELGQEISKKCGGIPIVLRHIGCLLYEKISEEDWEYVKNNKLLNVSTDEQNNNDDTVISRLKLSYNHLRPNLKQCFAYTSLFPKGYEINRNELIRQWVAQGFVESSKGGKCLEDIGKEYFKELCLRSFYETSSDDHEYGLKDDIVYMHDVMRDLAREVAGKKLYVRGDSKNEFVVSEQTRHISFSYKIKLGEDVISKLLQAKGLRTLILLSLDFHEKKKMNESVLDKLFSSFPRLRVLGLSNSEISKVSESIKNLRHLRYLDVSNNFDIESLPNFITKLQNLQTLNLTCCDDLKELPRDTSNLVNLRHLLFYSIEKSFHMPEGLEKLSYLQTLGLFVIDCKKFNKLREEFIELHCFIKVLRIKGLEQLRSTPSEVNLLNLKNKKKIQHLILEWESGKDKYEGKGEGEGDETILEGLEPHSNVVDLRIEGYCGERLPKWLSTSRLKYLTSFEIQNCPRLQHLNQLSHLQALKFLSLIGLTSLTSLSEWIGSITSLQDLQIWRCPKLESLPEEMRQLKSLVELSVGDCPQLKKRCKKGGEDWPNISHVFSFTYQNPHCIGMPQPSSDDETGVIAKT